MALENDRILAVMDESSVDFIVAFLHWTFERGGGEREREMSKQNFWLPMRTSRCVASKVLLTMALVLCQGFDAISFGFQTVQIDGVHTLTWIGVQLVRILAFFVPT
jgi:hypothetical protein